MAKTYKPSNRKSRRKEVLRRLMTTNCFSHLRWRASELAKKYERLYLSVRGRYGFLSQVPRERDAWDLFIQKFGARCDICKYLEYKTPHFETDYFPSKYLCVACRQSCQNFSDRLAVESDSESTGLMWLSWIIATRPTWLATREGRISFPSNYDERKDKREQSLEQKVWRKGMPPGLFKCMGGCGTTHKISRLCDIDGHNVRFVNWIKNAKSGHPNNRDCYWISDSSARGMIRKNPEWWLALTRGDWGSAMANDDMRWIGYRLGIYEYIEKPVPKPKQSRHWCDFSRAGRACVHDIRISDGRCGPRPIVKCKFRETKLLLYRRRGATRPREKEKTISLH